MGWTITSAILGIYLGDISANSADTHRLRIYVVFFSVASSVRLSLLACWSHEAIQCIVCLYPTTAEHWTRLYPHVRPPIAVVIVRSGFHCNATLRFESTVIPFSNYLIVMYDKVTHGEIRPIQRYYFRAGNGSIYVTPSTTNLKLLNSTRHNDGNCRKFIISESLPP
jgi:hypothetical protein